MDGWTVFIWGMFTYQITWYEHECSIKTSSIVDNQTTEPGHLCPDCLAFQKVHVDPSSSSGTSGRSLSAEFPSISTCTQRKQDLYSLGTWNGRGRHVLLVPHQSTRFYFNPYLHRAEREEEVEPRVSGAWHKYKPIILSFTFTFNHTVNNKVFLSSSWCQIILLYYRSIASSLLLSMNFQIHLLYFRVSFGWFGENIWQVFDLRSCYGFSSKQKVQDGLMSMVKNAAL